MAAEEESGGLWLTISALAEAKGVSQQAISKRVARLRELGLIATRAGARGSVLVNLAEYDRATSEITDLSRATAHKEPRAPASADDGAALSFTREQARKTAYAAELARLDLEERKGKLVDAAAVAAGYDRAADTILEALGDLESHADDLAAAVARDGARGMGAELRRIALEKRRRISDALLEEARILRKALPDDASGAKH